MMTKQDWKGLVQTVKFALIKHSPQILTGMGIAGMTTSTVLAVRATPKAMDKLQVENGHDLTVMEKIKLCWKLYLPATITGVFSIGCLIGATSVNERRNAALATAYSLSETALKEYREKVVETIGEKKEQAVRDAVAKDEITRNPMNSTEVIMTEYGNTLCLDSISGRYFKSSREKIAKAADRIDQRLRNEMFVSLNEFYDELGLPHIGIGDDIGWNVNRGYLEISYSTQLAQDEATPCLVILYDVAPEYDYR